jgi:transposase
MSSPALLLQQIDALKQGVAQRDLEISALRLALDKLTLELFHLRRMRYGRSSEKVDSPELPLKVPGAAVQPTPAAPEPSPGAAQVADLEDASQKRQATSCRTAPRQLPGHLPRQEVTHLPSPQCTCPGCGAGLRQIGQDTSEVLEYQPGSFRVVRHVRPRLACARCHTIVQASAPSRPIERGLAGAGVITQVLVGKFCDHLPLYRQSQIYARQGVVVERSTLADWVAGAARLLQPLANAVRRYVLSAGKIHTDDTPVPVLSPGRGTTRTARLWVYARDDRPGGDASPPAVWFQYSPDRKGEHPRGHLAGFAGTLQADAFAGYDALFADGQVVEAACWAHARRKYYEIHKGQGEMPGTLAHQALLRIGALYAIEKDIRGKSAEERQRQRQSRAKQTPGRGAARLAPASPGPALGQVVHGAGHWLLAQPLASPCAFRGRRAHRDGQQRGRAGAARSRPRAQELPALWLGRRRRARRRDLHPDRLVQVGRH